MTPPQLDKTAGILTAMLSGVASDELLFKPGPDRFSVAEVLAHLAHGERFDYARKYHQLAQGGEPALEAADASMFLDQYVGKDPWESLSAFAASREENVRFLRSLPEPSWQNRGRHVKVGFVSLAELANECAFHDLGHIRQIAELLRAARYRPQMGAYAQRSPVNP